MQLYDMPNFQSGLFTPSFPSRWNAGANLAIHPQSGILSAVNEEYSFGDWSGTLERVVSTMEKGLSWFRVTHSKKWDRIYLGERILEAQSPWFLIIDDMFASDITMRVWVDTYTVWFWKSSEVGLQFRVYSDRSLCLDLGRWKSRRDPGFTYFSESGLVCLWVGSEDKVLQDLWWQFCCLRPVILEIWR